MYQYHLISDIDKDDLDDLNSANQNILNPAIKDEEEPFSWFEWIYVYLVLMVILKKYYYWLF